MKVKEMKIIIISGNEKSFIKFIKDNFENKKEASLSEYRNNLNTLKKLDIDTLVTGIARVETIESHFSSIKSLSFIFALLGYLLTYYAKISVNILGNEIIPNFVSFLIFAGLFILVSKYYGEERDKTKTGVYFKVLLEYAKEDKKNKN